MNQVPPTPNHLHPKGSLSSSSRLEKTPAREVPKLEKGGKETAEKSTKGMQRGDDGWYVKNVMSGTRGQSSGSEEAGVEGGVWSPRVFQCDGEDGPPVHAPMQELLHMKL